MLPKSKPSAMSATRSTWGRALFVLASLLVAFNLVLQFIDWITSFIGYSRGLFESNVPTLFLIRVFGNRYLAVSIEKIGYIALFLAFYYYIPKVIDAKPSYARNTALSLLYVVMFYMAFYYAGH